MKKFLKFALMAAIMLTCTVGLTGCSEDDDDGSNSIVGEWITVRGNSNDLYMEVATFTSGGTFTYTIYEIIGTDLTSDNGKMTDIYKDSDSGTYTTKDGKLIIKIYGEDESSFDYSISKSGNNLTIKKTSGGSTETLTFEKMTNEERANIAEIEAIYQQMH